MNKVFIYKATQFLVIITAACLLLPACARTPSVVSPPFNDATISPTIGITPQKALVITKEMNGRFFSLKIGDFFEIQLTTIPMVGFEWTPKDLDTTILLQEGKPVYTADSSPNSAGGIVTLRYEVIGVGKTHLTLLYLRPTGNGVPSLYNNSFGVNIEVK